MIWSEICEHGKITISQGKPTEACSNCNRKKFGYQNGYSERIRFNRTLQKEFRNYTSADKWAKKRGLVCLGNEKLSSVSKQIWPDHPLTKTIED